jgi:hypothetical protein
MGFAKSSTHPTRYSWKESIMIDPSKPTEAAADLVWPEDKAYELTQAHYAAIGRVASEWASFETTIDTETIGLAGCEVKAGVCLTAQIAGWARKLDAYIALAGLRGALKTLPKLHALANATSGLAEQRNRVVHDPWIGETTTHRLEATARKRLRLQFVPMTTAEVVALADKILAHGKRFLTLTEEVDAELLALHEKPPPTSP